MAKYVKCVQDSGIPFAKGNCYAVVNSDKSSYLLKNDYGVLQWWSKTGFEDQYDLPEPITFSSQQEFEDAVMKVVLERLQIQTTQFNLFGRKVGDYYNTSACFDKEDKQ
jgi:hypothetical protein